MADAANTSAVLQKLLAQASQGDKDALGQLLELHRGYLRALAQRQLGGVAARLDASDLVQQTCLSACRNFKQFQEHGVGQFVAWLRRIHERNIQDAIREHVHAGHRAVNREQPMAEGWERTIATNRPSSPSGRLLGTEQAVVLTVALDELPADQREAVRLKHLECLPLAEIADRLGRSESAVAGLLKRGMQKLRERLNAENRGAP